MKKKKPKPVPEPTPEPKEYCVPIKEMESLLHSTFPKAQLMLWDKKYYYTSMERWGEILEDVLMNMPERAVHKFDCENFAFLTSSRVNERYHLNTCAIAIGMGWSHGFNVFIAENKDVHILEPETGEIDPNYFVDFLIMG